jgi:probable rRNA maturation factor
MTKPSDPPISFYFRETAFSLRNRRKLKHFIAEIFRSNKKTLVGMIYVFSTDRDVLKINRQYLNHDFYTDVITFNLSEGSDIQGEAYLSADRIKENAKRYNVSFSEELHRVIFHAALHLCGYRDKTANEKTAMRKQENEYLHQYFKLFHVKHSS